MGEIQIDDSYVSEMNDHEQLAAVLDMASALRRLLFDYRHGNSDAIEEDWERAENTLQTAEGLEVFEQA